MAALLECCTEKKVSGAAAGRPAVDAFIARTVTDHDLPTFAAARRVLLIQERAFRAGVHAIRVLGGHDEADHFVRGESHGHGGGGGDFVDEGQVGGVGFGHVGR